MLQQDNLPIKLKDQVVDINIIISDSITVKEYIDNKLFMAVLLIGGIYIAGQYVGGVAKSSGGKKSED